MLLQARVSWRQEVAPVLERERRRVRPGPHMMEAVGRRGPVVVQEHLAGVP